MTVNRVDAGRGWEWLVEGWRLFVKAPGIWIVMLLIYIGIAIVLNFIPFIGALAYTLITPALTGGMIYGAAVLAKGNNLEIPHLFHVFQDQKLLGPMLTLGALLLASYVVVGLVVGGLFFGVMVGGGLTAGHMNDHMLTGMAIGGGLVFVLLMLLVGAAITMAMFYAVPLVMLGGETPLQAVQDSFSACLTNFVALLVFGLVYLALAFLATLPLGLGFLVLGPVTFGALYASYTDVFGGQGSASPRPSLSKS